MGFLTLFFLIVFTLVLIPNIYASETNHIVYVENDQVVVYHKYFDQMDITNLLDEGVYKMFFTQNNVERLIVKFPNIIPLPNASTPAPEIPPHRSYWDFQSESYLGSCYRTSVFLPTDKEYDYLWVGGSAVLAASFYPHTDTAEDFCYEIFENPPPLKDCKVGTQNHINIRGESVCVSSVEKLITRGYLV